MKATVMECYKYRTSIARKLNLGSPHFVPFTEFNQALSDHSVLCLNDDFAILPRFSTLKVNPVKIRLI